MQDLRHHIKLIESMNNSDSTPEWIELIIPNESGPIAVFNHVNYAVKLLNGYILTVVQVEFDVAIGVIRVYFSTSDIGTISSYPELEGLDTELMPMFKELFAPYDVSDIHRSDSSRFINYDAHQAYATYISHYLSGQAESAWFVYLKNMDYETKLNAVKSDPDYIRYVDNPDETLQMTAVKQYPWSIQYIVNPTEAVQLAAIKKQPDTITYIDNPTVLKNPEVKIYIIKYLLERIKDNATWHVADVIQFLRNHGVNWTEFAAFDRSLAARKLGK